MWLPSANQGNKDAYTNAQRLHNKRKLAQEAAISKLETIYATGTPDLTKFQKYIDGNTRVYLVGHGAADSSELGGLNIDQLATPFSPRQGEEARSLFRGTVAPRAGSCPCCPCRSNE